MKQITVQALALSLFTALNIAGINIQKLDAEEYVTIKSSLRPIERQSNSMIQGENASVSNSVNWSGYVATTGTSSTPHPSYNSVTNVSGSWVVPTLTSSLEGDTFSSAWVGIDGYVNSTVEQIGTEHDVIQGKSSYYAWFSLYPAPTQVIEGFPVNAGDTIKAKVSYRGQDDCGNSIFCLAIKNQTQKVKFSTMQHTLPGYPAHLSSAEWIVEAPGIIDPRIPCLNFAVLPLANFSTIPFKNCKTIIDGQVGGIKNRNWTFDAITMISNSDIKSTPSKLNRGCHSDRSLRCKESCFNVAWESPGPFPYQVLCPPIVP